MLDANSIAALLPPPQNQPLGNAPAVVDDSRVTFPTTNEYLNYDAATLPPSGQEPTWSPTSMPQTTSPPVMTDAKTTIDLSSSKEPSQTGSSILWIGVCACVIFVIMAIVYWFMRSRGQVKANNADLPMPY